MMITKSPKEGLVAQIHLAQRRWRRVSAPAELPLALPLAEVEQLAPRLEADFGPLSAPTCSGPASAERIARSGTGPGLQGATWDSPKWQL
jgi:hypothetical protein